MTPTPNWGKQKAEKAAPKEKPQSTGLKAKLELMSMTELRKYAKEHNLKASDTKKEELISEILSEAGDN